MCTNTGTKEVMSEDLCDAGKKPPQNETCNAEACQVITFERKHLMRLLLVNLLINKSPAEMVDRTLV